MQPLDLTACGLPVFPCSDNKRPAIEGGFHSATLSPETLYFPSVYIGLPIPSGVVIIDIDTHKGMNTAKIDSILGCPLDWVGSLLQHTPSGGTHHAFQITAPMRQGSDLFHAQIGLGFDTRTTGKGYICTGDAYPQGDGMGVIAMSPMMLSALPFLPMPAAEMLALQVAGIAEPTPLPEGNKNNDEVSAMLKCIDADSPRDLWIQCAMALKHHYHDDDSTGFILFDNWSKTGTSKYDAGECRHQWDSLKPAPEGKRPVTLGTLAQHAIKAGYIPTGSAAALFGAPTQESAPIVQLETLIARINAEGGRPEKLEAFTTEIKNLICSDIQRSAITAALSRALKDNGIKITERDLKHATSADSPASMIIPQAVATVTHFNEVAIQPIEALGNVQVENAFILRKAIFGDRLVRVGEESMWWNGSFWESVGKADMAAAVTYAFLGNEYGKDSNVKGTLNQLRSLIPPQRDLGKASARIFFKNGVYDPYAPHLGVQPHQASNFNTSCLNIDYTPNVACPEWSAFLMQIFGEEPDRVLLLQELFGWCIVRDNLGHQKAIAFDGVPRSGKGTILEMLGAVLGNSLTDISLNQLIDDKALGQLRNSTLAVDRDAKKPQARDMSQVHGRFNIITANEPVSIPILYSQTPWEGRLNCKMAVACNGIPVMTDDSGAAPNRWLVLKFTQSFLGREDLGLFKRMLPEAPAVAAWAVEGLQRLIANGAFTMPASSIEESNALIDGSSPMLQFAEDRLTVDGSGDAKEHGVTLWDSFKVWCKETNNFLPSKNNFLRSLERSLQSQGVRYRRSVRINNIVKTGITGVKLKTADVLPANVSPFPPLSKEQQL